MRIYAEIFRFFSFFATKCLKCRIACTTPSKGHQVLDTTKPDFRISTDFGVNKTFFWSKKGQNWPKLSFFGPVLSNYLIYGSVILHQGGN